MKSILRIVLIAAFFLIQLIDSYGQSDGANNSLLHQSDFDQSFITWSSSSRISAEDIGCEYDSSMVNTKICDPFYLEVKILLDIQKVEGTVQYKSKVVIEKSTSSWNIQKGPFTDIFLNMYFDLYEIENRHLIDNIEKGRLKQCRIKSLHRKALKNARKSTHNYFNEINLGNNIRKVAEYSKYIRKELGIDNVEMLGVGLD